MKGVTMHNIPRKDREDADDVDEDEVSEVSGGFAEPDGSNYPRMPEYPQFPGGVTDPNIDDPVCPTPYRE
jgi:hypothetical protein